jgi:TPR repeat protein
MPKLFLIVLVVLSFSARAGFNEGLVAFERGDYSTAMDNWHPLAEKGIAIAQNNLGVMFDHGLGVEENDKMAVAWYRKAADKGNAQAQYSLGLMYGNGHGVTEDDRAAVKWYRLAAEQGSKNAQFHLALVYDFGEGVKEDDSVAAQWYQKAAELGDFRAQYNLALLYDFGNGVPKNPAKAAQWYERAAKQGDAKAQYALAASYFKGEGVGLDRVKSYAWMTLAASQRHVRALQTRGVVWAELSAPQRDTAKRLYRKLAGELALRKRLEMPLGASAEVVFPDPELVRELQSALSTRGYSPGPADGVPGFRTREALREFQRSQGLSETGEPSRDLLQLLLLR